MFKGRSFVLLFFLWFLKKLFSLYFSLTFSTFLQSLLLFSIQLEANNEQLEQMAHEIEDEKARNDALLREVLPAGVAEQLMSGATVDARGFINLEASHPKTTFSGEYPIATVMFADCPAFQKVVPLCKPTQLVTILNELFTKFDHLITVHGVSNLKKCWFYLLGLKNQDLKLFLKTPF